MEFQILIFSNDIKRFVYAFGGDGDAKMIQSNKCLRKKTTN